MFSQHLRREKIVVKEIVNLIIGIVLIVFSIWLLLTGKSNDYDISAFDKLPDHDYVSEITDLMNKYVIDVCGDVVKSMKITPACKVFFDNTNG